MSETISLIEKGIRRLGPTTPPSSARSSSDSADKGGTGPVGVSDCQLVEAYCNGSAEAFDLLYDRHSGCLHLHALSLGSDHATADDLVQDVFVKLATRLFQYRPTGSFRHYLAVILRNRWFEWQRTGNARTAREEIAVEKNKWFEPADPASQMERGELLHGMREAIQALPEEQRETLVLKIFQELSFREIAECVNAPMGTVISRYNYALARIREHFQDSWK